MSSKQAMTGIPSYTRHKASGQAVVRLNGIDFYLGPWNTPQSRTEYNRVISEWLARGRQLPERPADMLVKELIRGYHIHLEATLPKIEVRHIQALRTVKELYGESPVQSFGATAFKAIRLKMIEAGLCITTIRDRMGVIRRMVAWGVENEMLPADALQRIQAVAGVRSGQEGVKASRQVKPAPEEHVRAVLAQVNPTVRAMMELQLCTGARPGEIWGMTTGQIDRGVDPWLYRPTRHTGSGWGKDRVLPLGPKAQEVLRPWLKADPDAPLFSPREASERFHKECQRPTRTARQRAKKRKKNPKRIPGETYDRTSYRNAVRRGCLRADVPVFTPYQIRHTYGTRVRQEYGLEAAQVVLGQTGADATQGYAERNLTLAVEVAKKIG
jgi:integrase